MKILVLLSTLLLSQVVSAQIDRKGNGGDTCELRFMEVRNDIKSWILKSGSSGLRLPSATTVNEYNSKMLQQLNQAQVSCTSENVFIGSVEKTCINFIDTNGISRIKCNLKRFSETSDADQYILVHHEYAGLAGFEVNQDESSDYKISTQLSAYIEFEMVTKLAVKPNQHAPFTADKVEYNPITKSYVVVNPKYFVNARDSVKILSSGHSSRASTTNRNTAQNLCTLLGFSGGKIISTSRIWDQNKCNDFTLTIEDSGSYGITKWSELHGCTVIDFLECTPK